MSKKAQPIYLFKAFIVLVFIKYRIGSYRIKFGFHMTLKPFARTAGGDFLQVTALLKPCYRWRVDRGCEEQGLTKNAVIDLSGINIKV